MRISMDSSNRPPFLRRWKLSLSLISGLSACLAVGPAAIAGPSTSMPSAVESTAVGKTGIPSTTPSRQPAVEQNVFFHNGSVKCTLSLYPIDQNWDGHVTVYVHSRARVRCAQANPPYQEYSVNKIRMTMRHNVEERDGSIESVCGPKRRTRFDRAIVNLHCYYEVYLPYDCKLHGYSTAWVTENGVTKWMGEVSRHPKVTSNCDSLPRHR
jgi:hypothetical protein